MGQAQLAVQPEPPLQWPPQLHDPQPATTELQAQLQASLQTTQQLKDKIAAQAQALAQTKAKIEAQKQLVTGSPPLELSAQMPSNAVPDLPPLPMAGMPAEMQAQLSLNGIPEMQAQAQIPLSGIPELQAQGGFMPTAVPPVVKGVLVCGPQEQPSIEPPSKRLCINSSWASEQLLRQRPQPKKKEQAFSAVAQQCKQAYCRQQQMFAIAAHAAATAVPGGFLVEQPDGSIG